MQALSDDLIEGAKPAAEYLGFDPVSGPRKVYRMTAAGHLPVIKKGRQLFYRKSDLERAFQVAA